ncbi:MAG: restriction endonuclease subunit S [Acidobacteriota bacterium]
MSGEVGESQSTARTVLQRTASGRERTLPALPPGWVWTTMGEIAGVFRGASPRPKGDPRYFGGSIPWIMISDVTKQPGKYLFSTREGVTEAGAALSRRLPAGSLILSNSGTICVPKILRVEGCIHDGFVAFDGLQEAVDLDYTYWWFEYVRPRMIEENRQGMTQVNLNTDIVREIHFPLAPREEQHRIVDEIEKQITRLDAATTALKRVQANLKRYRASVLKAACEGRLVPTEAELARKEGRDYEPADQLLQRILRERRARWEADTLAKMIASGKPPKDDRWKQGYKDPAAPEMSELHSLPEGWAWTSLDQLALVQGGVTKGQKRKPDDALRAVAYLRVANVQRGYLKLEEVKEIEATEPEILELALRRGDVLLNEGGDRDKLGRGWIWEEQLPLCIHQNHVFRARPIQPYVDPIFLASYTNSFGQQYFFDEGKHTTNLASLSMTKLKALPVPLPPSSEQTRIVERLSAALTDLDRQERQIPLGLLRSDSLRRSILSSAFSGTLTERDPNDEPASDLLKRIHAERGAERSGFRSRRKEEPAYA